MRGARGEGGASESARLQDFCSSDWVEDLRKQEKVYNMVNGISEDGDTLGQGFSEDGFFLRIGFCQAPGFLLV